MKTRDQVREKENQVLTMIAEMLSEKMPRSEVYNLMDDIVKVSTCMRIGLRNNTMDATFDLLDEIGKGK